MKSRIILTAALTVLGLSQAEAFNETHTMNLTAEVNAYCTLGTGVTTSQGSGYFTAHGANSSTINVPINNQGRAEAITAELTLVNAVCTSPMHFAITGTPFKKTGLLADISGFAEWIPYTFDLFVDDDTPLQTITVDDNAPSAATADVAEPLSGDIRFRFVSTPSMDPLIVGDYQGTITISMTAP
jgi:hypothetical protein